MINPAVYLGAFGDNAPYELLVARGSIPQARAEGAYGRLVAAAGTSAQILWPDGAYNIPPAAGVQMSIVSTSANDVVTTGTGVRQVEMHYLDANLAEQVEVINMNGLTPVLTVATNVRFIQCLHATLVGSLKVAAGTINCTNAGTLYALISAGQSRCTSSARMVPAGVYLYVEAMSAGSISSTADAQVEVELVATELDAHQYTDQGLFLSYGGVGLQSSSASLRVGTPLRFSPGTIVAFRTSTDKAATVFGSWFGHYEAIRT